MVSNRKLLGAAAFSLALAGGGAAGAIIGTPSLSGAQDSGSSTSTTEAAPDGLGGRFEHRGEGLTVAAEALGMSEADLRTALEGGKSIAQVADDQGVELQTVIDVLVANGTTRLQEAIDNLPDRIAEFVQREGLPMRDGHGPRGHHGRGPGLEAAATAIGISADELRTTLEGGSTVADVAEANGVEVSAVVDALVAEATSHLDEAVANGRLTEDQAATRKATLEERITAFVNGEGPLGGPDDHVDDAAAADSAA